MFNSKDQERVLSHLLSIPTTVHNTIIKPNHILSSIPGISEDDFYNYLLCLEYKGYVVLNCADYPESDDFYTINITPSGVSYFSDKAEARRQDWRRWRMNIGVAVVSALTGAILARISMLLWP